MNLNEINAYILKNYPKLGKIKKISEICHDNINSRNYLITTSKNRYVLRFVQDNSPSNKIEKICKIIEKCRQNGIKVQRPILNKNNKFVDPAKKTYLTYFEPGTKFNGSVIQLKNLAKNLALLHRYLANVTIPYNYRTNQKFYQILTNKEMLKIKRKIINKKNKDKIDKKFLENFNLLQESMIQNNQRLPNMEKKYDQKQLIHHDLQPENVIFEKKQVKVIIDFNSMRKGSVLQDISFACFRFVYFTNLNSKKISKLKKIFIQTYQQHNEVEIDDARLNEFFRFEILKRLSFIVRKKYFHNSLTWAKDFEKNLNFLKLVQKNF